MKARYTLLAASLMMALGTASTASANPDWIDSNTFEEHAIDSNAAFELNQKELSGNHKLTHGKITGDQNSVAYMSNTGTENSGVFKGILWLDKVEKAYGVLANKNATVTNTGKIYATANTPVNYWKVKAMGAYEGGKVINQGEIIVNNALAFQGSFDKDNKDAINTFINEGTIIVENGVGFSMETNRGKATIAENHGSLIVKSGYGLLAKDGQTNMTFTNTGLIQAESGYAISVIENTIGHNAGKVTINLEENSHVVGLVDLKGDTTLNFVKNNNQNDAIQLVDNVGEINLDKDSHVTIEQAINNDEIKSLNIGTLNVVEGGDVHFVLNKIGTKQDKALNVGTIAETSAMPIVAYSGLVGDQVFANPDKTADLLAGVSLGTEKEQPKEVTVEAGAWSDEIVVTNNGADKDPTVTVKSENALLRSARDLGLLNATIWRSELSSLTDRMGTLRSAPKATGAWARYNGGAFDGDTIEHDYHGIEVGFDKAISATTTLGMSFGYTMGDSDIVAGEADTNSYKLGFYASHYNEVGCFVDTMFKIGRVNVDYDARLDDTVEHGEYNYTGMILGVEGGHRWNMNQFFVEPTVQLSYSHLRAEDYNTNVRDVRFDTMESLIARAAVTAGWNFAENGNAYVRVAYNHDFLGDVEGSFSDATHVRSYKDELDSNWGDFAFGADYRVNKDINTFVDVSRSFGGDIDQEWRVNLGARYTF